MKKILSVLTALLLVCALLTGCASDLSRAFDVLRDVIEAVNPEIVAYEDLGAEALRKLYVEDFPVLVIIDCYGNNLYETGREKYLKNSEK